ncbi:MAG: DegT/DnrJ/EryC1/StrS family aminotransferase [Patescibacteria group bacterium]
MILFNDFSIQHKKIKKDIYLACKRVIDSNWFVMGKEVENFEQQLAKYLGIKYCVSCGSGTDAITLSLLALGIGPGDQVLTTNMTAFPTITAIHRAGASIGLVDISADTGLINTELIEKAITKKTKAIIPVHLYGQACDLEHLKKICQKYKISLVEDCAQSIGATYKKLKTGTIGQCGAFSFYPTKNLGCLGDGGAVVTNNTKLFNLLVKLRNYGQSKRYYHSDFGLNSRLDEIQAAMLSEKLKYLDEWNSERRSLANLYLNHLDPAICLKEKDCGQAVYHLFVIKHPKRAALMSYLFKNGIQTLIHYPVPVNKQTPMSQINKSFPVSEKFANNILSLPLYPGLTKRNVLKICNKINNFNKYDR